MAYCDLDDLKNSISEAEIIQLTDDDDAGVVDTDKTDAAIEYADEMINGYLRGRYETPLDPVPDAVKNISIDLAMYRLFWRRNKLDIPDSMQALYKNAIDALKQMQKGVIILDIPDEGGPDTGAREIKTNKSSSDRVFSSDVLNQF